MERDLKQRQVWIISLVLALVTFAVYFPILSHKFVYYDDSDYVLNNLQVRKGVTPSSIAWAFTTGYASNWHPLTWISHMLDWNLYNFKHAGGHHLTNLLFHIANTLLLFTLLRRMTGALWRSAIVAALFAWHPLHVESVAWIAERKDVLSAFFWLLTMLTYVKYAEASEARSPQVKKLYGLTLLWLAMGLMSKPMVVTLPFVLLLMDFWPLKRITWGAEKHPDMSSPSNTMLQLIREKIPFFLFVAISSVVTFLVQRAGGAVNSLENMSMAGRVHNVFTAYVRYLGKAIWPHDLAVFYPLQDWQTWQWAGAAVLLAAITLVVVLMFRSQPWLAIGWFWYLGTLVPVIGLVQVGGQAIADRYTYLPMVGIFVAVVWSIEKMTAGWPRREFASAIVVSVMLAGCLVVTGIQQSYWQDAFTLFDHDQAVTGPNAVGEDNIGFALERNGHLEEAMEHYRKAFKLRPNSEVTLYLMGRYYARKGDHKNAADYLAEAIKYGQPSGAVHFELANAITALGQLPDAAAEYAEAVRLDPSLSDAHNNYGAVLMQLGKWNEAMAEFKSALRLRPDFPEAHDQLAAVLLKLGYPEEAQVHFAEAVRLKPDFVHARMKFGLLLAQHGDIEHAIEQFQAVLKLEPTNSSADYNLAAAYATDNHLEEAEKYFTEVTRLVPDDADPRARLAAVLAAQGKLEPAIAAYREALRLKPDTLEAMVGLAWTLATAPKAQLRNGADAVRLAERADALTGHKQPIVLAALDAAYAEAGRFDDAIKTVVDTQKVARAGNRPDLADQAAKREELYRAGKAFH